VNPLEWIRAQLAAFLALPSHWSQLRAEALQLVASPDPDARASAQKVLSELATLDRDWKTTRSKMQLADALGAVPILVGVVGLTAAVLVTLIIAIFNRSNAVDEVMDALREGIITPDEAGAILGGVPRGPFTELTDSVTKLALVVGGLFVAAQVLPGLVGRTR
jgi:hypothetical protein